MHYISDDKIKTTRDAVELEVSLYCKGLHFVIKLTS